MPILEQAAFPTLPMQFIFRPGDYPFGSYIDSVEWHLKATFGERNGEGNFELTFDKPNIYLKIDAQEEAVYPYAFGQFILRVDMHRPSEIKLSMRYPDKQIREVKHNQVMRRYLFHHWDRPQYAGKTPREFWGLHVGENALPSYPWDDEFIAKDAAKRSMNLAKGKGY